MVDMDVDMKDDMDDDRHLEVSTVAVTVWTPEPTEHEPVAEVPPKAGTDRTVLRLKIGLAAAIAVAVALAGALFVVRHQSSEEQLVTEAVAAYTRAWNAHDAKAVRAAMALNGTFSASDSLQQMPMFTAYSGPELERVLNKLFAAGVTLETTSRVLIAGDHTSRATVAQRFAYTVYGLPVAEDGLSQFTLQAGEGSDRGRLVVAQHLWWRPRPPSSPSMLWILES
jgi:hypothetical protein